MGGASVSGEREGPERENWRDRDSRTIHRLLGQAVLAGPGPAVQIEDAPRFAYRGVMLDVARHFFPVETVQAYIGGSWIVTDAGSVFS